MPENFFEEEIKENRKIVEVLQQASDRIRKIGK